ncbi:hypothetical protein F5146DRAFT_1167631 [Armillaria mellea]|nr:hypothetical protein F5146DRAFT_1167631 [Armillaria mellea]
MSYTSSRPTVLSYPEATRAFNDPNFILDLNEATQRYAQMQKALFPTFATISAQLHTLDLQGIAPPLRPRWNAIHSDFVNVMKHIHMNTIDLTGRAKSRVLHNRASHPSEELEQCDPTFTPGKDPNSSIIHEGTFDCVIDAHAPQSETARFPFRLFPVAIDHITLTKSYVGEILTIVSKLTVFHKDLAELACQHSSSVSGRNDLSHLAMKFLQLENHLKQLYHSFSSTLSDTTIIAKTSTRLIAFSGNRPQKSTLSAHRVALADDTMTQVYDQLEQSKSEVTHAQYVAEVSRPTGALNTARWAVSSFVFDLMVNVEYGLSLFLAVYHSIMNDCVQMVAWLQNPVTSLTPSVSVYVESGMMLYAPIGAALELYSSELDNA